MAEDRTELGSVKGAHPSSRADRFAARMLEPGLIYNVTRTSSFATRRLFPEVGGFCDNEEIRRTWDSTNTRLTEYSPLMISAPSMAGTAVGSESRTRIDCVAARVAAQEQQGQRRDRTELMRQTQAGTAVRQPLMSESQAHRRALEGLRRQRAWARP